MCGIAGEFRFDHQTPSVGMIAAMNERMQRHGPKGSNTIQNQNICLSQRRTKAHDRQDRKSQQPMLDQELGLGITLNGAIYNCRSLRSQLEEMGHSFISGSDTEVLLKAYHAWGLGMLPKLQGMFAFALWDKTAERLIVCRDRMGIKPLYYSYEQESFRFASTLPALMACPTVDKSINRAALHYYLMFHAVPAPLTILNGVFKLSPGTALIIERGGAMRSHRYWAFPVNHVCTESTLSESEWMEELEAILLSAVGKRLTAEGPAGILLSGGLDSSLLAALVSEVSGNVPESFSIGFESNGASPGDEFQYSDMVSDIFHMPHQKLLIKNDMLHESLRECMRGMSEPMTSHANIGFNLLAKEISQHVNVVQSGHGADEIFTCYPWLNDIDTKAMNAEDQLSDMIADRSYEAYLETVTTDYQTDNYSHEYLKELCKNAGASNLANNMNYYESTFALSNGPLARIDNMTMDWGIEARIPFLDHEVVEFASTIPISLKVRGGSNYILKNLARKWLPDEIVDRPKTTLPVPALQHPDSKALAWMQDVLNPDAVKRRGIINIKYISKLLRSPGHYRTPSGELKLWQLCALELWLQAQQIH